MKDFQLIRMRYLFNSKGSHISVSEVRNMGFRSWSELGRYLMRQCELGNVITPFEITITTRAGRSDRDSRSKVRSH